MWFRLLYWSVIWRCIRLRRRYSLLAPTRYSLNFMNNQIASADSSIHLGNVIGSNIWVKRVEASIADFNRRTNVLLSSFHNVSTNCLYKKCISICMSLYGCQLWDVSHRYTSIFLWVGVKPFVECLNRLIVLIHVYCTLYTCPGQLGWAFSNLRYELKTDT